jgi:hypothetical protein
VTDVGPDQGAVVVHPSDSLRPAVEGGAPTCRERDHAARIIPFPQYRIYDDDWEAHMATATCQIVSAYEAIEKVSTITLPAAASGLFDLVCRSILAALLCLDEFGAVAWPEVDFASTTLTRAGRSTEAGSPGVHVLRESPLGGEDSGTH